MDTSKVRHKDGPPGYTCPNFRPVQERTLNETEHGSGVAGWNCRGHRLVRVGLFYLHKDGAVLRGHAEEGALPRPAPLPSFAVEWIVLLFVMSILLAHLYAWSRTTAGAGPRTAIKIGMIVGFCAG